MKNLQILLRGLNAGHEEVIVTPKGEYIDIQCRNFNEFKDMEVRTIESRLQYELFGEWPLSKHNLDDWNRNMYKAFYWNNNNK